MRLLERDDDLAALVAHWERARAGRGGLAVVAGEAGAGKSSLLQAFADDHHAGTPVLWGACDPLSLPRPLGPLHDVADQLGLPRSVLDEARQSHEIFAAVFECLARRPAVFIVDDLHWADQGTIDLLRFLLRRIRTTRSLVVGTVRDDEIGPTHPLRALLGDVARSADGISLALRPLSLAAVASLVDDRPVDPERLHRITSGNPFFVVEMLGHTGDELPTAVRDAVLARTTDLEQQAWDLLHLLACAPEAIPDVLLPHLGIGLVPLRAVGAAGLIRRGRRGVAFRHDLCRGAIAETIPPGGEVALHRRMLDALESSGLSDPAVLTHHAVGAGDRERVVRHASAAGRAAARSGAHTQAAGFFRVAVEQGAALGPSDEAGLLELLAAECYLIDRLDDAIGASQRAMRLREQAADAGGVSVNHHALSVYHWYNAERGDAEHHASEAVAVLDGAAESASVDDRARRGHGLAMQAYLAMHNNDVDGAGLAVTQAALVAEGIDEPTLSVRVGLLGNIWGVIQGDAAARDATLVILDTPEDQFDEIYSSGYSYLTYLDVEQRRLGEASELLGVSLPLTVERDLPICRVWQLGSRGRLKFLEGDWAGALEDAEAVLAAPSAPLARTWPHLVRGLVTLRRSGTAEADLDEAWRFACRYGEPIRLLPTAAALVEQAWLTGRPEPRLDECRALLARSVQPGLEWGRGELASWLRRLDPGSDLGIPADDVAAPYRLVLAGRFEEAAEAWAGLSVPYEQALALVDTGDPDAVRAGVDLLDRLGADEVAAKVRHDLRRRGITAVPARRRETTLANPAGLTAREVEVLGLLGQGLTNAELAQRLFISAKTVDHHVSAILAKLGVAGRRDAVHRARQLGVIAG
ncbi:MAG: AAA family ATPase [Actinobacteria bacterium]|nr:AAA family ATPase [Actinomycetota bacterium]